LAIIGGFGAIFEAKSWGGVGILLPTSILYKPKVLGRLREVQRGKNAKEIDSQSHFYVGKPLKRETLWAISGSFVHLFSVLSVVLGY
jgi:hypothetical protein